MPIYEYACGKCEREFEVEQRITDDPIKSCPHCRSRKVRRLISQTSFVLKGGGWYSDLYSSGGKAGKGGPDDGPKDGGGQAAKASGSSKSDSDGGGSGKGDAKDKPKGKGAKAAA